MNKDQFARLSRHRKVKQVLADNADAVAAVPAFAMLATQFLTQMGLLNIRQGEPFRRAPVVRQVPAGAVLPVVGRVVGEAVNGNDDWYELDPGSQFCWSGAVR